MWSGRPALRTDVVLREEGDEGGVLFDAATGDELPVNGVGATVVRLLDGTRDLAALVAGVGREFAGLPASAPAELAAFVQALLDRGLALAAGPPPPPAPARPRAVAGARPSPRLVHLELTARCNLRCRYCYYFDQPAVPYQDQPTDHWLRLLAELAEAAVLRVILAGGEPFMRPDLPAILDGIVRHRMRFSVLTNGGLIDDERAARLAATGRCDGVQVSLDGPDPAAHDAARGRGSFALAVRGLATLRAHALPVTVRLTVHRGNVARLEEAGRFILEELAVPTLTTNAAGALGSCPVRGRDLPLDARGREVAMAALLALAERYPGRVTAAAGPHAEALGWMRMEAARRAGAPPFPDGGRLTGCGCPREELTVRADGAFVPCPMLPHLVLGRAGRDRLLGVWRTAPALVALRERSAIALDGCAACAGCAYVPYCTGNCPATAYALTGALDQPSPDGCLRRYLAAGGRLPG